MIRRLFSLKGCVRHKKCSVFLTSTAYKNIAVFNFTWLIVELVFMMSMHQICIMVMYFWQVFNTAHKYKILLLILKRKGHKMKKKLQLMKMTQLLAIHANLDEEIQNLDNPIIEKGSTWISFAGTQCTLWILNTTRWYKLWKLKLQTYTHNKSREWVVLNGQHFVSTKMFRIYDQTDCTLD